MTVLNILVHHLPNAMIHYNSKDIITLTYTNTIKAVLGNNRRIGQEMVHLVFRDNSMHVQSV